MAMRNDLEIEKYQKQQQQQQSTQRLVCDFDEKSTDDRIMMRISKHYEVQDRSKVSNQSNCRVTRQMNLCSTCGTYYGNWSLFLHMHEVHKKCICLHCHGVFPNVEKLVNHLKSKHQIDYVPYESLDYLQRQSRDVSFLMCVQCQQIMTDRDPMLLTHSCVEDHGNENGHQLVSLPDITREKTLVDKNHTMPTKQIQQQRMYQQQQILPAVPATSGIGSMLNSRRKRTPSQKSLMSVRKQTPEFLIDKSNVAADIKSNGSDVTVDICRIYENGTDSCSSEQKNVEITNTMPVEQKNAIVVEDQRKFPKFTLKLPPKLKITNSYDKEEDVKTEVTKTEIEIADEQVPVMNLNLDQPLDKINIIDLMKMCISSMHVGCEFCNHARRIAVNGRYLGLHMIAKHRFTAVVNSITAEELFPENFVQYIESKLDDLEKLYINLIDEEMRMNSLKKIDIECLQCRFKMNAYKELHSHNKKLHSTSIMVCIICKSSFFNYSDLLGHLCPGKVTSQFYEIPYRCYLCNEQNESLPSTFRLMVHFRKKHNLCELCLEFCENQTKLAAHVLKHKFNHFCYRCCIAYRNKPDITKHLFWKHGTESKECKRCLQKKWPHIYHFCLPPPTFTCEECNLLFTRSVSLKVHQRFHSNTFPYACTEDGCDKKFVSRKLQQKHIDEHLKPNDVLDAIDKMNNTSKLEAGDSNDLLRNSNVDGNDSALVGGQLDGTLSKKMRKKQAKKMRELAEKSVLEQLPALNLSESDSDSDEDSLTSTTPPALIAKKDGDDEEIVTSGTITEIKEENEKDETKMEIDNKEEEEEENVSKSLVKDEELDKILEDSIAMEKEEVSVVQNVWDNFKNFLDQNKGEDEKIIDRETKEEILVRNILYVCQMDHDYLPALVTNGNEENRKQLEKPVNVTAGGSSSSSSSSDSDSDSINSDSENCRHDSNCSCSSSDDSSTTSRSTSSSSDDEEKSTSTSMNAVNKNKEMHVEKSTENDLKTELPPEYLILETDLDTEQSDYSDTEEFYDKQPATLGNKFMKEKRRSLGDEENSRHSKKKKKKSKKKNREKNRKISTYGSTGSNLENNYDNEIDNSLIKKHKKSKKRLKTEQPLAYNNIAQPYINNNSNVQRQNSAYYINSQSSQYTPQQQQYYHDTRQIAVTATMPTTPITSTRIDETVRTSKRRRVPNKFYGYSSDEDNSNLATMAVMKSHSVPSNLKWRKTDLPRSSIRNSLPSSTKTVPTLTIKKQQIVVPNRHNNRTTNSCVRSSEKRNSNHVTRQHKQPPLVTKIKTNSFTNHYRSYYNDHSDYESESEGSKYVNSLIKSSGLDMITSKTSRNNNYSDLSYLSNSCDRSSSIDNNAINNTGYDPSRLYCICQCPYDEVSEMIACDSKSCKIEWFHFECVGIMVPPKGQWFCPDCRKRNFFKSKAAAEAAIVGKKL